MNKRSLLRAILCILGSFLIVTLSHTSELFATAPVEDAVQAEEVRQLQERKADFVLIDARSQPVYKTEHIEGAVLALAPEYYEKQELFHAHVISVPPDMDELLKQSTDQYPKNMKIVTYCNKDCQASEVLMLKLRALGFSDVKFMQGGIDAWKEKGYPVVLAIPTSEAGK